MILPSSDDLIPWRPKLTVSLWILLSSSKADFNFV